MDSQHASSKGLLCVVALCVVSACGARSGLADQTPQEQTATSEHDADRSASSSTALFVESDTPIVLLPAPCNSSDAAPVQPSQPSRTPPAMEEVTKGECGNARDEEYESCDDGNSEPGDGCDASCQIEPYHVCPTGGQRCVRLEICGDGVASNAEACDDGNLTPGDGCSPSCQVEVRCGPNGINCRLCTATGGPCVEVAQPGYCGDGAVHAAGGESCDRGTANTSTYGGCTETCSLAARCGDLVVQACGQETCDDGNRVGGDGCSADCRLEQRWVR